jgi:hypothetical protein
MPKPHAASLFHIHSSLQLFVPSMSRPMGIAIAASRAAAHFSPLLSLQALLPPGMPCTMQQTVPDTHNAQADGAALAAAAALASVAAAASAAAAGQQHRWLHVTLCYSPPAGSLHDAVCVVLECAAVRSVCHRLDASGKLLCELCPRRLSECGPHRPHGGGRAHVACIMRHNRAVTAPTTPTPRSKWPYNALKPTQRRARRCTARAAVAAALSSACCPPTLSHRTHVHAASLCCAAGHRTRPLAPHTPSSPQSFLARLRGSRLLLSLESRGLLPWQAQHSAAQSSALLARM